MKTIRVLFINILFICQIKAQDIITTKKGEEISCKVIELDPPKIKYRLSSQPDGPIRNITYGEVFMIKFADGTKEVIDGDKQSSPSSSNQELVYPYTPFSLGVGPNLIVIEEPMIGAMLSFAYEIKPISIRTQFDALVGFYKPSYTINPIYGFNLNLQYVFKPAKGKIELVPEFGIGIGTSPFFRGISIIPYLNIGTSLNFRVSKLLAIYMHPRYQLDIIDPSIGSIFSFNAGIQFRFGK